MLLKTKKAIISPLIYIKTVRLAACRIYETLIHYDKFVYQYKIKYIVNLDTYAMLVHGKLINHEACKAHPQFAMQERDLKSAYSL